MNHRIVGIIKKEYVGFIVPGLLAVMFAAYLYSIRSSFIRVIDDKWVTKNAASRLQRAGPERVRAEAENIFSEYGVDKITIFRPSDKDRLRILISIGHVGGILPGAPPYIRIGVNEDVHSYVIDIMPIHDSPPESINSQGFIELGPMIYAHSKF